MLFITFFQVFSASASTVVGNPTSEVAVVDGEDVHVHSVVAERCAGGIDKVTPGVTLDKGESVAFTLDSDLYCTLTVEVSWVPEGSVQVLTVADLDELDVVAAGGGWLIEISEAGSSASFVTY